MTRFTHEQNLCAPFAKNSVQFDLYTNEEFVMSSLLSRKQAHDRRSERYSIVGRRQELRVESLLQKAVIDGKPVFSEVVRHFPNSKEDQEGRDFTVTKLTSNGPKSVSFGISISRKSSYDSKLIHPDVVQLHFPINMKDESIVRRVNNLFSSNPA